MIKGYSKRHTIAWQQNIHTLFFIIYQFLFAGVRHVVGQVESVANFVSYNRESFGS